VLTDFWRHFFRDFGGKTAEMAKGKANKRKAPSKAQPVAAEPEVQAPVLVRNSLSEAQGTADLVARLRAVHEELKQVSQVSE
jgi:hypothetical protein